MIMNTFEKYIDTACSFYDGKPSDYNVFERKDTNHLLDEFNLLEEEEQAQFLTPYENRNSDYLKDFQKLAFFFSNFQYMIKRRSQMKFSEEYLCSEVFYRDSDYISGLGENLLIDRKKRNIRKLFRCSVVLTMPIYKHFDDSVYKPQEFKFVTTTRSQCHSLFSKFHEVAPDLQFNFNFDGLLDKLSLKISTFEKLYYYCGLKIKIEDERSLAMVYLSYLSEIEGLLDWGHHSAIHLSGMISDVTFHHQQLIFPLHTRLTGVLNSIKNAAKTNANKLESFQYSNYFLDIYNQIAIQAILCNSDISIVLDSTCCLVFEHSQISQPEISFVEGRYLVNMKSTVTVVDLVNSDLTPNIILAAIFCDKLNRINEPNHMEHLLRCITVTDEQRLITLQNQKEFCKSIWDNKFNKFIRVGPDYIYQSRSFLKIPERYYQILIGAFGFTEMKFDDFYSSKLLVSNDRFETPLSRVYKVYHKSNPGIPLILKVYDARTTTIKKWRPQLSLDLSIGTMLEMFAKEVEAYTRLGHNFSCKDNTLSACSGLMQNSNRSNINMPNLLASGFLDSKNANEPSGFFLLQSFIPNDPLKVRFDQALQVLTMIHEAGFVHCNIKRHNVLFSNGEVYFINFGSSIYRRGPCDENMEVLIEEDYYGKEQSYMRNYTIEELQSRDIDDLYYAIASIP